MSCCSGEVSVYSCSSPCLLPGAWLRNYSQESRLQVVLGGALILLCLHPGLWSISALQRGRVCVRTQAALCALKYSGKFSPAKGSEKLSSGVRPRSEFAVPPKQSNPVLLNIVLSLVHFIAFCSLPKERFIRQHCEVVLMGTVSFGRKTCLSV